LPRRLVVHRHHGVVLLAVLTLFLIVVVAYLLFSLGEVAFGRIGFTPVEYAALLASTLVGSAVNVPVSEVRSSEPIVEIQEIRAFWVTYRIPRVSYRQVSTVIAVNLGGAIIPACVSIYLLAVHPGSLLYAAAGSLLTAFLVHLMARKVRGVGIVTPALLPPIAAAVIAYLLAPGSSAIVAYVSGTLGALVGADLTNLRSISKLGAPMASIGGAGTFDGVFLTGVVAVLLVPLLQVHV
jgi:uncharacterized membrane protein